MGEVSVGGISVQEGLCQGDPLYSKERVVRFLRNWILVFYCELHEVSLCNLDGLKTKRMTRHFRRLLDMLHYSLEIMIFQHAITLF